MRTENPFVATAESDGSMPSQHARNTRICTLEELNRHSPPELIAAAKELLLEYGRFVQSQAGVASFCFGALEREAAELPESYLNQGGGAILAGYADASRSNVIHANGLQTGESQNVIHDAGTLHWAGFVAWRELPFSHLSHAREVKRLWVRPEARGLRMGLLLMQALLDRAISDGKTELFLDTAPATMAYAHRLYEAMGFIACPPYRGEQTQGILCMRKPISNENNFLRSLPSHVNY